MLRPAASSVTKAEGYILAVLGRVSTFVYSNVCDGSPESSRQLAEDIGIFDDAPPSVLLARAAERLRHRGLVEVEELLNRVGGVADFRVVATPDAEPVMELSRALVFFSDWCDGRRHYENGLVINLLALAARHMGTSC